MTSLEDLDGEEFANTAASLFRALGYEEVRVETRTGGSRITMRDGETAILVECVRADSVSRSIVEELHSAVASREHDGPSRGIVVTSGRFTAGAREYVRELLENGDPYPIELIDRYDVRELGKTVGMDIVVGDRDGLECDRTLPVGDPDTVVRDVFQSIENAPPRSSIPAPETDVLFEPIVDVEARTQAALETGDGSVHRIDHRDHLVIEADRSGPRLAPDSTVDLVGVEPVPLEEEAEEDTPVGEFGRTESEYREWIRDQICDRLEKTVTYTDDEGNTRERTFRPSTNAVRLGTVRPLYLPRVKTTVELGAYTYRYVYNAADGRHAPRTDEIHQCVHCDGDGPYTYCDNCGSVNCPEHIEEERLVGEPVCTGCAVTGEFFFATKYFYDESNRETFRERYEEMPLHRKLLENPRLVAAATAGILLPFFLLAVLLF